MHRHLHRRLRRAIKRLHKQKKELTENEVEELKKLAIDAKGLGSKLVEEHTKRIEGFSYKPEESSALLAELEALDAVLMVGGTGTLITTSNLLYFIQTYSMMMTLVYCTSLFLGSVLGAFLWVMIIFNQIKEEDDVVWWLDVLVVALTPFYLFLGSVFLLNAYRLLVKQFSGESFCKCRALMLGVLLQFNDHQVNKSCCQLVQLWFTRYHFGFVFLGAIYHVGGWCLRLVSVLAFIVVCFDVYDPVFINSFFEYVDEWVMQSHRSNEDTSCLLSQFRDGWRKWNCYSESLFYLLMLAMAFLFCAYQTGPGEARSAQCFGTLWWGFVTMLIHTFCDWYTSWKGMESFRADTMGVEAAIRHARITPGQMATKHLLIKSWFDTTKASLHSEKSHDDRSEQRDERRWDSRLPAVGARSCLVAFAVLLGMICLGGWWVSVHRGWWLVDQTILIVSLTLWILFIVYLLLWACQANARHLLGLGFRCSVFGFVCVVDLLMIFGLMRGPLDPGQPIPAPLPPHQDDAWVFDSMDVAEEPWRHYPPYPPCIMRFGAHNELRVLDLAILSAYAYNADDESFEEGGDVWTNTSATFGDQTIRVEIVHAQRYSVGRVVIFRFTKNNGTSEGTTVMVVKGSSTILDFYVDTNLWAMITTCQMFMPLIPILDAMPDPFTSMILQRWPHSRVEENLFDNLQRLHKQLSEDYPDDTFIITGHSLGGGIATAAGGQLEVTSIAFSGPGSHFSRWRFGTTAEGTFRTGMDIKPKRDYVHKVDRHDEFGGYIQCRYPDGKERDPATCHSIRTTTCELWRACGDHRSRDFRVYCSDLVESMSNVGKVIKAPW